MEAKIKLHGYGMTQETKTKENSKGQNEAVFKATMVSRLTWVKVVMLNVDGER